LDPYLLTGSKPGRFEESLPYYEKLTRKFPAYYYNSVYLAWLQLARNEPEAALSTLDHMTPESGIYSGMYLKDLYAARTIALSETGKCPEAIDYVHRIDTAVFSTFPMPLFRTIPTRKQKAYAWYSLYCDHDLKKASGYLGMFTADPAFSAEEKTLTNLLFTAALRNQRQ
jgi:hypothetical protein